MRINIIAAVARNRAIGLDNKLLYWIPSDLKRFKSLTTGNTVIMGRHTFESLPKGALPDRRNIVLSRTAGVTDFPNAELFRTLEEALADCRRREAEGDARSRDVYIIGGASVYRQALAVADRLFLTCIDDTPLHADAFFPEYDAAEWTETSREEHAPDERNAHRYAFVDMERRPSV